MVILLPFPPRRPRPGPHDRQAANSGSRKCRWWIGSAIGRGGTLTCSIAPRTHGSPARAARQARRGPAAVPPRPAPAPGPSPRGSLPPPLPAATVGSLSASLRHRSRTAVMNMYFQRSTRVSRICAGIPPAPPPAPPWWAPRAREGGQHRSKKFTSTSKGLCLRRFLFLSFSSGATTDVPRPCCRRRASPW